MKEMIKRVREEKGGFTLAELLIVVAIVLVLVAIAIPVFTGAMGQANTAVVEANARSAQAQATTDFILKHAKDKGGTYNFTISADGKTITISDYTTLTDVAGKKTGYTLTSPSAPKDWDGKSAITGTITIVSSEVGTADPPAAG